MEKLYAHFYKGIAKIVVKGLTQWDYGQKLYITGLDVPATLQVHFSNDIEKEAMVMVATQTDGVIEAPIPDIMLEKRIAALEKGEQTEPVEPVEYPEYVEGKWYYNGDKVSFKGKNYECIAPSGVVCTWSPEGYPTYWKVID